MSATHHAAHAVVQKHATRPAIGFGASTIPKIGLLVWCANRFDPEQLAFIDRMGGSVRPLHDLQYIQADGTGYFVNAALVTAGITVTQVTGSGTTTYSSPSAGRINMTAGTAWDFTVTWSDAVVSEYKFASRTGETAAVVHDVSGNGLHLTVTGFADITGPCSSGKEIGSDWINLMGFSEDSTTYSYDTIIPASTTPGIDALGNTLTYPGRAKYNPVPSAAPCVAFDGGGYIQTTVTGTNGDIDIYATVSPDTISYEIGVLSTLNSVYGCTLSIMSGGRVRFYRYANSVNNSVTTSTGVISVGEDCTLRCTFSKTNGNVVIYKNGVSVLNTTIANYSYDTNAELFRIGKYGNYLFEGKVYNVNINGVHFPLSEGSGTTVFGYDTSGNNYTATCTSFLDEGAIWSTQSEYFHGLTYGSGADGVPANPYTPGLDCLGNALTNPPLKWNESAYYTMPDADQIREALGWEYGTANNFFADVGSPIELSWTELIDATDGLTTFASDKYGVAIYSLDAPISSIIKAARMFGYVSIELDDSTLLADETILY